jgi:hypothetical protein
MIHRNSFLLTTQRRGGQSDVNELHFHLRQLL